MWRTGDDPVEALLTLRVRADDASMDLTMTIALTLIGAGAMVAGATGITMPAGERIAAALALVIGAGAGVIALAIGVHSLASVGPTNADYERVFLIASAIGFLFVLLSSLMLWRRARS